MNYQRNVIGQCGFDVEGITGTATLVETRAARVSRRVEICLAESRKVFSVPVEIATERGFWSDARAVWVPRPPEEQCLFRVEEITSFKPLPRKDSALDEFFGPLVAPPLPRPRREHAGGAAGAVYDSCGAEHHVTGAVDFDYDAVDASLGFDGDEEARQRGMAYGAATTFELLNWLQAELDKGYGIIMHGNDRNVYIRVQVLRYYLDRDTMGAPTLEQLRRRLGVSKETLRFLLDDLEARYGLVSPLRKSVHARKALSAAPRQRFHKP